MDLCRVLLPEADLTITGAMMSNRNAGLDIEDHAVLLMQGGGASCMVETGYLYPAPNSVFDLHYSIRTEKHYFIARDDSIPEIVINDRQRTTRAMKLTNVHFYPTFVREILQRLQDGRESIVDLSDNGAPWRWWRPPKKCCRSGHEIITTLREFPLNSRKIDVALVCDVFYTAGRPAGRRYAKLFRRIKYPTTAPASRPIIAFGRTAPICRSRTLTTG